MKLTQRENAYRQIRQMLFDGGLQPGVRLSPVALAREIGVSHIPVREAITQLQSEGLVEHVARRGSFVRRMSRNDLIDSIEIRTLLECNAAVKAALRISRPQLADLEHCWQELARLASRFDVPPRTPDFLERLADYLLGDLEFHMCIFARPAMPAPFACWNKAAR